MQYGRSYNQGAERYMKNLSQEHECAGNRVILAGGDPNERYKETTDFDMTEDGHYKLPTDKWSTLKGVEVKKYITFLKKTAPNIVHMIHPGHIGLSILIAAKSLNIKTVVTAVDFWWVCPKNTLITTDKNLCDGNKNLKTCTRCIAQTQASSDIGIFSIFKINYKALSLGLVVKLIKRKHYSDWQSRPEVIEQVQIDTNYIITLSNTAQAIFEKNYPQIHTECIPAGLHPRWFAEVPPWRAQDYNCAPLNIGFAGTIAPHKGLHILLKALHGLPKESFCLNIAGASNHHNYNTQLKELAVGLNINWLGSISEESMVDFIDSMDIIVVPSLSPENQPQVILESHARNTPVICSDMPGCVELVDSSLVYGAQSPYQLTKLLALWRENPYHKKNSGVLTRSETSQRIRNVYINLLGDPTCF